MPLNRLSFSAVAIARAPVAAIVDMSPQADRSTPDNKTVVWPVYRDPKLDIETVIKLELTALGITDVPILKSGALPVNLLVTKNTDGTTSTRPVICLSRGSDRAVRHGLGELSFVGGPNNKNFLDPTGTVPPGGTFFTTSQFSNCELNVDVYDMNATRRDQFFVLIKYIMMVAQAAMMSQLNYISVTRTGTEEDEIPDERLPGIVFHARLSYMVEYSDDVALLPQIGTVIKQRLTTEELVPAGHKTQMLIEDGSITTTV